MSGMIYQFQGNVINSKMWISFDILRMIKEIVGNLNCSVEGFSAIVLRISCNEKFQQLCHILILMNV